MLPPAEQVDLNVICGFGQKHFVEMYSCVHGASQQSNEARQSTCTVNQSQYRYRDHYDRQIFYQWSDLSDATLHPIADFLASSVRGIPGSHSTI